MATWVDDRLKSRGTSDTKPAFSIGHLLSVGVVLGAQGLGWKGRMKFSQ